MSSNEEKVQQNLVGFFSCLITAASYCHGEGWPGFKDYLTQLNNALGKPREADDVDRNDVRGSIIIMRVVLESPDLIAVIADRAIKERGRTFN